MKKTLYRYLITIFMLLVVGLALRAAVVVGVKKVEHDPQKPYSFHYDPAYRLGAMILRPVLEAGVDRYIERHGLVEHLSNLGGKVFPEESFAFNVIEAGSGRRALCGQDISASVMRIISKAQGSLSSHLEMVQEALNSMNTINFKLGTHNFKELNYAIDGMSPGESGLLTVHTGNHAGGYYISLVSTNSPEPTAVEHLLTFDKNTKNYRGVVTIARCGDRVSVRYTIRDARGLPLLVDQTATFVIGESKVPLPIELGVRGLRSDQSRSIIVPSELLQGFDERIERSSIKIIDLQIIDGKELKSSTTTSTSLPNS